MNGHECYIIGAGDFYGLREAPDDSDYVIAADAGYRYCRENNIIPDLVRNSTRASERDGAARGKR